MNEYYKIIQKCNNSTILDVLEKQISLNPDKIAYSFLKYQHDKCNEESITYKELSDKSKTLAAFLQKNHMEGKQALLLFPDGLDFIIAFWGCLYAKVIAVPLYHFVSLRKAERLLGVIQDSKANIVLADEMHINRLETFMDAYQLNDSLKWCPVDKAIGMCSDDYKRVEVQKEELAYLQYTSGSTSQPKGVMITHENIMHNMDLLHWYIGNHEDSIGVSWIPHYHDMGLIYAIIQPVYLGYRQVLMEPSAFVGNPYRFLKAISDYRGTTFAMPNFAFDMCCDRITDEQKGVLDLSSLESAVNGAEPVYAETMKRFIREFACCNVKKAVPVPGYGLAEATLIVSANDIQDDGSRVSLLQVSRKKFESNIVALSHDSNDMVECCCSGRLRDDVDIKIVNPQSLKEIEADEIGEIWISSNSVSPGYWEKEEVNLENFQAKIKDEENKKYLRTGDLGFVHKNHLYITGRLKDVIIVRGANYYPNDIEYTIGRCHEDIVTESCAAFVINNNVNDEQLIIAAEIRREASKTVNPEEVYDSIRKQISEIHGLRVHGILLLKYGSIPKTSSGKIQRFLCKKKFLSNDFQILYSNLDIRSPFNHAAEEKLLIGIEKEVLKKLSTLLKMPIEGISTERDLVSLGLDSISLTVLKDFIEEKYCNVELGFLFECSIKDLVQFIRDNAGIEATRIPNSIFKRAEDNGEPYPFTSLQNAYWMGRDEGFELGGVSAHVLVEVNSEMELDYKRLNNSWNRLIQRHEMLRTIITYDGQQVTNRSECMYEIVYHDLINIDKTRQQEMCDHIWAELANQVFEIGIWPWFEIHFADLGCGKGRLYVSIDLMIADIWSLDILFREWFQIYSYPEKKWPELEVTFRDYCKYNCQQEKQVRVEAEKYWKDRISSIPQSPRLPLAKPPSDVKNVNFIHRSFELNKEKWACIKNKAKKLSVTPSSVLMAGYAKILSIWANSDHFSLNLTMFNRSNVHKDINNVVGDFTTVSVLEVDNRNIFSLSELAKRIQKQLADDMEYRDYNGIKVMRDLATYWEKSPKEIILPIVFTSAVNGDLVFQNECKFFGKCKTISQTPQVYLDHQVYESNGKLSISWDSVDEVFPENLVNDMFNAYRSLINELATNDGLWEDYISSYLPGRQKLKRAEYNDTKCQISEELLYSGFLRNLKLRPDNVAILTDEMEITYNELGNAAFAIAEHLCRKGIRNGAVVPILMEKGWEQIAAAVGINMAGAAYVSIDPELPRERKEYIVNHCGAQIVIVQAIPEDLVITAEYFLTDITLLKKNTERMLPVHITPDCLSYILYTSGSTGVPKGVAITHRAALNTILDINKRFLVSSKDRIFALSSFGFDLSVYDFYGMLNAGGGIVIPKAHTERDPDYWIDMVNKYSVTIWNSVPSLFEMMVESMEAGKKSVRIDIVLLSGDWIPVNLPDRYKSIYPNAKVISLGGATEASIWSIFHEIDHVNKEWNSIPYGKPLCNQEYYVLNKWLGDCPDWVTGDLYIGGVGLAQEYYKEPEKTSAVFIIHPGTGKRIYKTGDLGRFNPNNYIEFLGREDFQVKIGGFRIEIGEIESVINKHPGVQRAMAAKVTSEGGNTGLVAYVIPEDTSMLNTSNNYDYEAEIVRDDSEELLINSRERLQFKLKNPAIQVKDDDSVWTEDKNKIYYLEYNERPEDYVERISCRRFLNETIAKDDFNNFISMLKKTEIEGTKRYRYGSAGGAYPVQIYLYIKPDKVEGISEGIYYYHPIKNCLVPVNKNTRITSEVHVEANKSIANSSAFTIFMIGKMSAIKPLYGKKARDFCLVESGLISQMFETAGIRLSLGTCQIGAISRMDLVSCALNLADDQELLHTMVVGKADLTDIARGMQEMKTHIDRDADRFREEIKNLCTAKLPYYMVPAGIILLSKIPLTSNGKVDYKKLPKSYMQTEGSGHSSNSFSNKYEQLVYDVFRKKADIETLEINTSFFDMGINSLTITRAWREILEKTGKDFPVIRIFENPTIVAMAKFMQSLDKEKEKNDEHNDVKDRAQKQRWVLHNRRKID